MDLALLTKIITPFFKGTFTLPKPKNPENELVHIVGVSSGIDSTATALCLKILFPTTKFLYIFTDTQWEVKGTIEALNKLEAFLKSPIIRIRAPMGLIEQINKCGGYIPSGQSRFCTSYQKIFPLERYMEQLRTKTNNGKVEFAQYTGIRADEPTREGAQFSRDTSNNFPLQSLGLTKTDVNNIVNQTVGIPLYYMEKSRSGCTICIHSRRSEVIDAWETEPEKIDIAAGLETLPNEVESLYRDLPKSVAVETNISRNWMGYIRPDWLGYTAVGSQGTRGKAQRKETIDMFSEKSKTFYAAVEYQYHNGVPGLALPQVYMEKFITYSTSLSGIKKALKFFWQHRLHTKEIHYLVNNTEAEMVVNKQIAIIQLEVDDYDSLVPPKPKETFTWQSDQSSLLAIRKNTEIIKHILLCEGLRQDGNKKVERVSKEYGRVLNFSEYSKPEFEELEDDFDIEDEVVACNTCSR
jgi:3'-phosphoadenosine 5'-phosphosulfate sulfotransferase (PAPS reductase)/FAD synthetase